MVLTWRPARSQGHELRKQREQNGRGDEEPIYQILADERKHPQPVQPAYRNKMQECPKGTWCHKQSINRARKRNKIQSKNWENGDKSTGIEARRNVDDVCMKFDYRTGRKVSKKHEKAEKLYSIHATGSWEARIKSTLKELEMKTMTSTWNPESK
jgi:hypothetical protein